MQTSPNTQQLRNTNQQNQQTDKWEQIRGRLKPHSYICVHSGGSLHCCNSSYFTIDGCVRLFSHLETFNIVYLAFVLCFYLLIVNKKCN